MSAEQPATDLSIKQYAFFDGGSRPLRYILCITLRCNLRCDYCYVSKNCATMPLGTAQQALDFIFRHAPPNRIIEIGFFGGEPLLEFPLLQEITALAETHPSYDPERVRFSITTNGTIFSDKIADFFRVHAFKVCVSCDGIPEVQNLFRHTAAGKGVAPLVERTLLAAGQSVPHLLVNSVYHPQTFRQLPQTLDYFSGLGLRQIFLNPDYSANWTRREADDLPAVYRAIAGRYIDWYLADDPHFVSLIDAKISVLMRGGYHPLERCQMGRGEMAITPDGGVYPCERLIGSGTDDRYRIGSVQQGLDLARLGQGCAPGGDLNPECAECSLKECCMNWCGCSNTFMTGYYNRVGPFLCASERAAITTAMDVFTTLEQRLGPVFFHHLAGAPNLNSQVRKSRKDLNMQ